MANRVPRAYWIGVGNGAEDTTRQTPLIGGSGLGFGPGLAPQGERIPLEFTDDRLVLWPASPRCRGIPHRDLRLEPGGFDRDAVRLTWTEDGAAWTVALDPAVAKALRHDPPLGLRSATERLESRLKRGRVGRGVGWSLIATIVLLPLVLLIALWWQADRLVDAAVARIPPAWEERLGDTAYQQMAQGSIVITEGPALAAVEGIGRRLASAVDSPYTFDWHVVDDPQINAFALPGGHVVVYTGLLRSVESADELAGVLAHEIQHVLLRHSLRGVVRSLGWRAVVSLLFGDLGALSGVGGVVSRLGDLRFGREQEAAADLAGLDLLRRARIDPDGMVQFFEDLARQEGGRITFLSTHPISLERAARLQEAIDRFGPWPVEPLPFAWDQVRASLPRREARRARNTGSGGRVMFSEGLNPSGWEARST